MIAIRADANTEIGTGHIMRCLSVAHALRERGSACLFVSADDHARALVEGQGFSYVSMQTEYQNMEAELPALLPLLATYGADLLLTDSYFVTDAYFQVLRRRVTTAYMDDLAQHAYPVDILINYNNFATQDSYQALYPPETKLLIGMAYAPLRAEFQGVAPNVREKCGDILLSTGGTDPLHVGIMLLQALTADNVLQNLHIHIIVGALNADKTHIKQMAQAHPNIVIHQNVTQMAQLMQQCDIAISASGSTLYELCACGIPTVCYTLADNQLLLAENFAARGLMQYAGDMRQNTAQVTAQLVKTVRQLADDSKARSIQSSRMHAVLDGQGALRLANALTDIVHTD